MPCLLLGYSNDTKGYQLINLKTGKMDTQRLGNLHLYEAVTVEASYVRLLLNLFRMAIMSFPVACLIERW